MRILGHEIKRQISGIDDINPISVGGIFPVQEDERDILGWAFMVVYPGNLTQNLTPKLILNPQSLGYKSRDIILHSLMNGNTKVTYYYSRHKSVDPEDAYHRASMAHSVLTCAVMNNEKHIA